MAVASRSGGALGRSWRRPRFPPLAPAPLRLLGATAVAAGRGLEAPPLFANRPGLRGSPWRFAGRPRPGLRAACGGCRGLCCPPPLTLGLLRSWRRPAPGRWGPGAWWASWRGGVAPRPVSARRRAGPARGFPPSAALGLAVAVAWCPGRGPPGGATRITPGGVFRRCGGGVLYVELAFYWWYNILRQFRPLPPWPPPPSGGRGSIKLLLSLLFMRKEEVPMCLCIDWKSVVYWLLDRERGPGRELVRLYAALRGRFPVYGLYG